MSQQTGPGVQISSVRGAPLEVGRLLEASVPRPLLGRFVLALPAAGLLGMISAVGFMVAAPGRSPWLGVAALAALAISAASILLLSRLAHRARHERRQVDEIDELIALRHFPIAAARLEALLSRPMRLWQARLLSLAHLARVLMRYERFEETIEVGEAIMEDATCDPALRFAAGCMQGMAMLRGGRLFDAGETIGRLRREVNRLDDAVRRFRNGAAEATSAAASAPAQPALPLDSVALTLVELYRDVQTRHNGEALAMLESKRLALRDGLGVRFADALALGSVAAHRLGEPERARQLWSDATCLVPALELRRRYPDVAEADEAYPATPRPAPAVEGTVA